MSVNVGDIYLPFDEYLFAVNNYGALVFVEETLFFPSFWSIFFVAN